MNESLKEIRKSYNLTAKEAANFLNIPIRTYMRYENNDLYGDILKRNAMISSLKNEYEITEDKGILKLKDIEESVLLVINKYKNNIDLCYLFGSYAKGYATEKSDVDLCVLTNLTGLKYVGFTEEIRKELKKKVEVVRLNDLENNIELIKEIMKDGIKIYG